MYMIELHILSKLLVVIGALNWGLVGILNFDLVAAIFGKRSAASRLIYALVGLAAAYLIIIAHAQRRIALAQRDTSRFQRYIPRYGR
jgi:uncharacterized protein